MKRNSRQILGKWGEEIAAQYLTNHGHQILERNYRSPYGEIDLITRIGDTIVFTEVKTRASHSLGKPEISVSSRKQLHMIQSAEYYIQQHLKCSGIWRIDVIAIERQVSGKPPVITQFENAIS
jgi:putative endonuclease